MAGSERSGVEFANSNLFGDAPYALIADHNKTSAALRMMTEVVESIGARPIVVTAEQHDRIAARISHVPQLLSTALALAVARARESQTLAMAGTGFAEAARLAESRWSVWEDICGTNADEIEFALDDATGDFLPLLWSVVATNPGSE